MDALLIVDVQNDFLPGGALAVPAGDMVIPVINIMQNYFTLVIATQDWHPKNHKSFASNHIGKKLFDVIDLHGLQQTLWPDHCVQGSWGADWPVALDMYRAEAIFRKGTNPEIDSYSGFFDNGHRKSTGLADYIHGKNVTRIFLTGLCADICVYYTAMDAMMERFETFIIEDATCPLVAEDAKKTNRDFIEKGGKLIRSDDIIKLH